VTAPPAAVPTASAASEQADKPTTASEPAAATPEVTTEESTEAKTEGTQPGSEPGQVESEPATEALQSPETAATSEASSSEAPETSSSEALTDPPPEAVKDSSSAEPETLIFRPGASWGTPKLDKASTKLDTSVASTTVKQNGCPSPRSEDLSPAEEESPSRSAAATTPAIDYSVVDPCPPHPSGRRVYAFDFLLSVATKAPPPPEGLQKCEVYLYDGRARRGTPSTPDSKGPNRDRRGFGGKTAQPGTPGYHSNKIGHFDGDMRSKMGKVFVPGPPGGKTAAYENLSNRADTAFNLQNARNIDAQAKILKKVRGILNRITPEKYSVLFEQLWAELQNDQVDVMGIVEQVIHTVFDIALDQPKFSFLYADVCYHLCRKIQTLKEQEPEETTKEGEDGAKQSATLKEFRRILLNTCQARFEEGSRHQQTVVPDDATEEEREAIEKAEYKFKSRSLGNIKFIAELFKRSLLSERIMHIVIKILLLDTDHTDPRNVESMETLNEMLNTVGKKLDRVQAKPHMDMYFQKMAEIAQIHPVKRIKFLILNMIELRNANWVSRQDQKQQGAETDDTNLSRQKSGNNFGRQSSWNNDRAETPKSNAQQRSQAFKEPKKQQDKQDEGFKTVGKSGGKNSAWEKNVLQAPAAPTTTNMFAALKGSGGGGGGGRQNNKDTNKDSNRDSSPISNGPATATAASDSAVDSGAKELPDEKVLAKGKGLLEEYTANPDDNDNAIAILKEEISSKAYSQFLAGMILCAVSQNKREKERAALPKLCAMFAAEELIEQGHLHSGFVMTMEKAKREELWVDVPKLWQNIGVVLAGCFKEKVVDLEVLAPMAEVLINDEEYQSLAPDFLKTTVRCLNGEEFGDCFDGDKLSKVLAAANKAVTKKKTKSKAKVTSIDEFEAALAEIPFQ